MKTMIENKWNVIGKLENCTNRTEVEQVARTVAFENLPLWNELQSKFDEYRSKFNVDTTRYSGYNFGGSWD